MNQQNYILDALDVVLAWDIPEEGIAETVKAQACLMAGINPEEIVYFYSD